MLFVMTYKLHDTGQKGSEIFTIGEVLNAINNQYPYTFYNSYIHAPHYVTKIVSKTFATSYLKLSI